MDNLCNYSNPYPGDLLFQKHLVLIFAFKEVLMGEYFWSTRSSLVLIEVHTVLSGNHTHVFSQRTHHDASR